jgi:hypothetical protein
MEVMLRRIFATELVNFTSEEEINEGRKRIDITASNRSKDGFFFLLKDTHNIHCPWI